MAPPTLPTGITRDRRGYRVYVRVRGQLRTRRYPAETSLHTMLTWRLQQQAPPETTAAPAPEPNTFAADVAIYLELKKGMTTYQTREAMMADWSAALGPTRDRRCVTSLDVARVLAGWHAAHDYAPSSLNHYRSALSDFYTRLDPTLPNPVKGVPKFREPKLAPRGLDPKVVSALFDAMPDRDEDGHTTAPSKARAMMEVLYTTGLTPMQIRQLTPESVDVPRRRVLSPGRDKGEGTVARWKPLTTQGVAALKRFTEAGAWGGVHRVTLLYVFRRAAAVVRATHPTWSLPAEASPYWLRHAIGTTRLAATNDLYQTQLFMGHADPRTTLRYVGGAVGNVERHAVSVVGRALSGLKLPTTVTQRHKCTQNR